MSSKTSQPGRTVPSMTNYTSEPPSLFHPDVEVRVSKRRKKTAGAHWEGDRIVIVVPTHLRGAARDEMVENLARRMMRHRPLLHTSDDELAERARSLADRYLEGVEPASIRWATNQNKRWGSCTIQTREIRISHRLKVVPAGSWTRLSSTSWPTSSSTTTTPDFGSWRTGTPVAVRPTTSWRAMPSGCTWPTGAPAKSRGPTMDSRTTSWWTVTSPGTP